MQLSLRWAMALGFGLCCLGFSRVGWAEEWSIDAGGGARGLRARGLGPLVRLGVTHELSDPFAMELGLTASRHERGTRATTVLGAALGLSASLDIIRWVPSVFAELGAYDFIGDPIAPKIHGAELGASLGVELDYLVSRRIALGASCQGDAVLSAGAPQVPAVDVLFRFRYSLGW